MSIESSQESKSDQSSQEDFLLNRKKGIELRKQTD